MVGESGGTVKIRKLPELGDRIRCRSGRRCEANRDCTHGVLDCVAEPFEGLLLRGPEHDAVLVGDCLVGLLPEA
jgi:hypothetical protein